MNTHHHKLLDRVSTSGKVSPNAFQVLYGLLNHHNIKTGRCNPGIKLLTKQLFPNLTEASGYHKTERALDELRKAGIVQSQKVKGYPSEYRFNFNF